MIEKIQYEHYFFPITHIMNMGVCSMYIYEAMVI